VATAASEVLAVPVDRLRDLVARDPALGDLILRAYLIRRTILIGLGVGLRIVGSRYSPDARRRDFAAGGRVPLRWLGLETDPGAEALLSELGVAPADTPIVIVHGRLLRDPSNAELAAAIGLPAPSTPSTGCDLLVVGSGPAASRPPFTGPRTAWRLWCWTKRPPGPGRRRIADRELSRIPVGYLRGRARGASGDPGAEVRGPLRRAGQGDVHRAEQRSLHGAAGRRSPGHRQIGGDRHRRQVPSA
jgi:hypothetical protein